MSDSPIDASKRTWLIASGCAGAVGSVATAVPFVSSFQPSERAKAAGAAVAVDISALNPPEKITVDWRPKAAGAGVEVDISALTPGEKITVEWRGKPVWIVKRTPAQLAELPKLDDQLADPQSRRKPD